MKIAICEDLKNEQEILSGFLYKELNNRKINGEISILSSGEEMLTAMRKEIFPINFLDIYMDGISGIDIAREIRKKDKNAAIVFTTSSLDHMADGYEVGAAHYLVKPYTAEAVGVAFERCLRTIGTMERFVEVTSGGYKRKLLLSQIICVESQNKSCLIKTQDESLRVYVRLNDLLSLIDDECFLRCHRSFAVNLNHVACITGKDFLMKDNSLVPIKREDRSQIKQTLQNYTFKKLRGGC